MESVPVSPPDTGTPQPAGIESAITTQGESLARVARPAAGPYDDRRALLQFYTDFREECLEDRTTYERDWWKKLWYRSGRQWIYFDRRRGQYQDKRLLKWMPRPVTNVIAETVETLRAIFNQVQLGVVVRPLGQDPVHVAAAEVADELEPVLKAEHDMARVEREKDFWLSSLHSVFMYVWWDKRSDTNGTVLLPDERCEQCGAQVPASTLAATPSCPSCGGGQFSAAVGPDGQPAGRSQTIGKGATDVYSPLEVLVPSGYTDFARVPGLICQRWRTKRWWQAHYPDLSKTLVFSQAPAERSLQLARSLATMTDTTGSGQIGYSGGSTTTEGLAEMELWYKPCDSYPDGLFMRVAGDSNPQIVEDPQESTPGPLPHQTKDGKRLFPWIFERFSSVGGRLWGAGPIDLILQKQDQLNQLDAFMLLSAQRTANPIWLKPKGAEVSSFTGEPGLVVEWNPLAAGGQGKPERIAGENIPNTILKLREIILSDIERLAGTYDVIKGNKPTGVEAFSALQLLVERSQSRFGGVLAERGEGYRQWMSLALELERQYGPPERVFSVLGPNRQWTYKHFQNAQLQGAIELLVEDGSQIPKTNLGKRAAIEQANQIRLIDPNDPDVKMTIFRHLGLTDLSPAMDANVTSALEEQDSFETWLAEGGQGTSPMVVQMWHEDPVHLAEHKKWANGDAIRRAVRTSPAVGQAITQHLAAHEQSQMLKQVPPAQRAAMAQQMAGLGAAPGGPGGMPAPGGPAPGGAGRAMTNSTSQLNAGGGDRPAQPSQPTPQTPGVM